MSLVPELIAGLAIFALGAVLSRVQRKRRVLEWSTTEWTLISGTHLGDRVKISFDGKEVQRVWVTIVDLVNTGNDAVLAGHFVEPIRLALEGGVQLLEVTLSGEAEGDGKVIRNGNELRIAPRLFNSGDALRITCLTDRKMDHELYVRAENTALRWRSSPRRGPIPKWKLVQAVVMLLLFVTTMALLLRDVEGDTISAETMISAALLLGITVVTTAQLMIELKKRLRQ